MSDNVYAVIFAGGIGSRMEGAVVPKQFLELGGKPIIVHTIEHFEDHPEIDGIVVVCVDEWIDRMRELATQYRLNKIIEIVPGGNTGQESIFNGLIVLSQKQVGSDAIVLIHDGVRPLIDTNTITACIESVNTRGCTATIAPSQETIIEISNNKTINVLDRSICKLARAPQGFRFEELYNAHLRAQGRGLTDFTDSISLMAHFGYQIFTIEGPVDNIKITTKKDYFAFKGYMDYKELGQLW